MDFKSIRCGKPFSAGKQNQNFLLGLHPHVCHQSDDGQRDSRHSKRTWQCRAQKDDFANQRENHFHGLRRIDSGNFVGLAAQVAGIQKKRGGDDS